MYSQINLQQVNQEAYISARLRFGITVVITLTLVAISAPYPLKELVFTKDFYHSLIVNYIMAGPIIWALHYCNKSLDNFYPWQARTLLRPILQLVFGIVGILIINTLLVRAIFSIYDIDFEKSRFMENIFPLNIIMVIAANVFLFLRQRRSYRKHQRIAEEAYAKRWVASEMRWLNLPLTSMFNFCLYQGQQLIPVSSSSKTIPLALPCDQSLATRVLNIPLYTGQDLFWGDVKVVIIKEYFKNLEGTHAWGKTLATRVLNIPLYTGQDLFWGDVKVVIIKQYFKNLEGTHAWGKTLATRVLNIPLYTGQDLFWGDVKVVIIKQYFKYLEGTHAWGKISVDINEVIFMQTASNKGVFFTRNNKKYKMRYTADDLRERLDPDHFGEAFGKRFYAYNIISAVDTRKRKGLLSVKPEYAFITKHQLSRRLMYIFDAEYRKFLNRQ